MSRTSNTQPTETQSIMVRGIVDSTAMIAASDTGDRKKLLDVIKQQRSGFLFSYTRPHYQLHVVDRFALYPLFYTIQDGMLQVSQVVDDLLPYLKSKKLHAEGYYGTGGIGKGDRTPYTPFAGIMRIPPGHLLEYRNGQYELIKYWSFTDLEDSPFEGSYEEACDILGSLIKQGVDRCYAHDSKMAVHLSGGIDSGSITALLAQSKHDTIHAYAHVKPDAPDDHPTYENGYLRKYVEHYPNISICKSHTLSYNQNLATPIRSAGNWHLVKHDSPEGRICQDLSSKKIPYLLSGVGGDELASYGHGHQKSNRKISSDTQARRFMYRDIYLKRKLTFLARGILGKDGPRLDSITSTLMMQPFTEKHKWYHPNFRAVVPDLALGNLISLYWFPSTYEYRLKTLQKSYFMIRSDMWNFLSRYYGIDYMFPLMDADLVEFCARLPREFFVGQEQRNMIKKGLKKYLHNDLLTGGKRPGYQPPQTGNPPKDQKDPLILINEYRMKYSDLNGTLASSVFDLDHIDSKLKRYQSYLKKMPQKWVQTRRSIQQRLRHFQLYLNHADYINTHFDNM